MKLFFMVLSTIGCVIFGLIPEIVMYFVWGLITPVTIIEKILVVGLFWFGGAGLCAVFAVVAGIIWLAIMTALAK